MRVVVRFLTCVVIAMTTSPLLAYNSTGHKVIASICYRQLDDSQRSEVLEILKKHPRFKQDFRDQMPDEVRNGDADTQAEWLFQQAAIWPDLVRSGPPDRKQFHRPLWHYVNMPCYLTDEDRDELDGDVDVNLNTEPPTGNFDDKNMNVVQSIKNSFRILVDDSQPDSKKAVHICWLLHCVGDLHQPLHATALFSRGLFPEGDRGGNSVRTQPLKNLHSAWDGSFGSSTSFQNCRNLAIELVNRDDFDNIRQDAIASSDPIEWRDESFEAAKDHAYNHEVMLQLEELEQNGDDIDQSPVQLSVDYLSSRRMVADRLALLAGIRCAQSIIAAEEHAAQLVAGASARRSLFSPRRDGPVSMRAERRETVAESTAAGAEARTSSTNLQSEIRAMNEKLDQIIELLERLADEERAER